MLVDKRESYLIQKQFFIYVQVEKFSYFLNTQIKIKE